MDNATIRSWAKSQGIDVNLRGNVEPKFVAMYIEAMNAAPKAKPKKPKKAKAEAPKAEAKAETPKATVGITEEFGEHFSERTIQMVVRERGDNAGDVLRTALAFMQNGMRSRYAAVNKAMAGETPRIATEKADKPKAKAKAKAAADKAVASQLGTITGYMVLLPSGAQIRLATEAEADKVAKLATGAIVAPIIGG